MQKKPRRFVIDPSNVELIRSWAYKDDFVIRASEYGKNGQSDKEVDITIHSCFFYAFSRIIDQIVKAQREDIERQESNLEDCIARFHRIGEGA